jgi:hypothetical protein
MKEFEPSGDFVAKVMKAVFNYENELAGRKESLGFIDRCRLSGPFRFAVSSCGILFGVFLVPATCL